MFAIVTVGLTLAATKTADPWAFGWDALVAIGTLFLALVTFGLVLVTRLSISTATDEIGIERRRVEASQ